nr:CHC2 zinc finger domain-containing protein [Priestia koreensis]
MATGKYQWAKPDKTQSGKWFVKALKTVKEIERLKRNFSTKFKKDLKNALIVETYSGFHIYWLIGSECTKEMFEKIEQALINKFGSDPQVKNAARLLRVPGFYHQKYDEPFLVKVIQWTERKFTPEEFIKEQGISFEKKKQTQGYTTIDVQQKVSFNSNVTRGINKIEFTGANAQISFKDSQLPTQKASFAEALHIILNKPLSAFVTYPEMVPDTKFSCPFHTDDNPSATVFVSNRGEEVFYCHSCEAEAKNIIGLYMLRYQPTTFRKAVTKLALKLGIAIVEEDWERELYAKHRDNRHFFEFDVETLTPNLFSFLKTSRFLDCLRILNDKSETSILKQEFMYKGENVYFVSNRYMMDRLGIKSMKRINQLLNLIVLIGFSEKVPEQSVPSAMKKRAEKELYSLKKEMSSQGEEGKKRSENVKEINFYIVRNWNDVAQEMENMARLMREKGFVLGTHMNKTGLIKLLGKEIADRVYPDERKAPKRFETVESKLKEFIETDIEEKGFSVIQDVITRRIRFLEVKADKDETKKLQKQVINIPTEEKDDVLRVILPAILEENNYQILKVRDKEKKKRFGFDKKSTKEIKVIINNFSGTEK